MKQLLIFLFVFGNLSFLTAQNNFEAGSYVDNNGNIIQGFIKNIDWLDNPKAIDFKPSVKGLEREIKIDQILAFEIPGISRYERHTVQIDYSSSDIDALSEQRAPQFQKEVALLQVLVEGATTLYEYSDNSLFRFFYSNESQQITPLIYKQYSNGANGIQTNNRFRQQLSLFNCEKNTLPQTSNLQYRRKSLMQFFNAYNDCKEDRVPNLSKTETKTQINIKAFGGITSSSFNTTITNRTNEYSNGIAPTFGIEVEGIFPFNNKKWALFADIHNLSYNGETKVPITSSTTVTRTLQAEFSAINISAGARHYMFLNDDQKLFLNLSYGFEAPSSLKVSSNNGSTTLSFKKPSASLEAGIGYTYKRLSLEARYIFQRDHLGRTFVSNNSEYKAIMLTLGYKFLSF